jgi:hypothetical protein
MCSVRTAYSRKIVNVIIPKKFELPVHAAIGRRYRWRTT